jgi:hypothetical protein
MEYERGHKKKIDKQPGDSICVTIRERENAK